MSGNGYVNLESLSADRPLYKDVTVEAWRAKVRINALPTRERFAIHAALQQMQEDEVPSDEQDEYAVVETLARALTDGEGTRMFDSDAGRERLRCDPAAMDLYMQALDLNSGSAESAKKK